MSATVDFAGPDVIVRDVMKPDRAIDDFLGDCRARGWSERSLGSYAATLDRFAATLPDGLDVAKITTDQIRRYRMSRQRKVARNTLSTEEAHLSSWLKWLRSSGKIAANPMENLDRTRRIPAEDLDVTTVSPADVVKMLGAARPGAELNAVAILCYLGPRRGAAAALTLRDYTVRPGFIRFHEKGAKTIYKPVPAELALILDASIARHEILEPPQDYLVPPEAYLTRKASRDDRVIYRLVKKVADRARVDSHVHALRAAFATFYLDQYPDDILGLKDLLGHRSLNTTLLYLRRRNRQAGMERVRGLSWAGNTGLAGSAEFAVKRYEEPSVMGAGGFEPPFCDLPADLLARSKQTTDASAAAVEAAPEARETKGAPDE